MRLQAALVDDEYRSGTIANLARIRSAQHAAFLKQLHRADRLYVGVEPNTLVDRMHAVRYSQRHDLVCKRAGMNSSGRSLMTAKRVLIELLSAESILVSNHLRADELAELLDAVALADALAPRCAQTGLQRQNSRRTHRHPTHAFDAGCDHDIL